LNNSSGNKIKNNKQNGRKNCLARLPPVGIDIQSFFVQISIALMGGTKLFAVTFVNTR